MPLIQGFSDAAFDANIEQLIKDGFPRDQALAIALNIQAEAKKAAQKTARDAVRSSQ